MRHCLALLVLLLLPAPAQAQMVCGERNEIVRALEEGHEEHKTGAGVSGYGALVELYTASSGTWTLLLTLPNGPTCLLGSGEDWEAWAPQFLNPPTRDI